MWIVQERYGIGLVWFDCMKHKQDLAQLNCYLFVYGAFFGAFETQSIRILRDVLRRKLCVSLVNVNFACFVYTYRTVAYKLYRREVEIRFEFVQDFVRVRCVQFMGQQ